MPDEDGFQDDFQQHYDRVAQNVNPGEKNSGINKNVLKGVSVLLLLVLVSSAVAVHFSYPQYAFWRADECQYQFDLGASVEEDGQYRFKIGKHGSTPVDVTLSGVQQTSRYSNLTVSDQVFLYLPSSTQSVTVYGQCDRSATYRFN